MDLHAIGKRAVEWVTIIGVICGLGWGVAKPRAQDFIKETVKERLSILEQAAGEIQKHQREQDLSSVRTESDLATVKASQREVQESLKVIIEKLIKE